MKSKVHYLVFNYVSKEESQVLSINKGNIIIAQNK